MWDVRHNRPCGPVWRLGRANSSEPAQPIAYGPNWRQSGMQTVVFYLVIGVSFGGLIIGLLYWIYSLIRGSSEE